jgi:hypothetical protein
MSFADLLRQSRQGSSTVLHKFLTTYSPGPERIYLFVEGQPDEAFYRAFVSGYLAEGQQIFVYNCEGKDRVYEIYEKVVFRYPRCTNVMFFVDKDVDDVVGIARRQDPRIYVTEYYSIESYLVSRAVLERYFSDFVKIKRVTVKLDDIFSSFDQLLSAFYSLMTPVMAYIVNMRRSGNRILLNDLKLGHWLRITSDGIRRTPRKNKLEWICGISQTASSAHVWQQVRKTTAELKRLPPKSFIRGKFEAWFLLEFVKRVLEDLSLVAREADGSISVSATLNESNFVQLLLRGIATPSSLQRFLDFHLRPPATIALNEESSRQNRLMRWVSRFFGLSTKK